MNETGGNARYRSLKVLAWTLCSVPVLLGVVMYFVIGTADGGLDNPPAWVPIFQVVLALVLLGAAETLGFSTIAAESGEPNEVGNLSFQAYQSAMILRFGLCEALAIVSLALAFVATPSTLLAYVPGGLLSLALLLFEVLPRERNVAKTQASLERRGQPSYLREALGLSSSNV